MKEGLVALSMMLCSLLSFAQNGSVSFGVIPTPAPGSTTTNTSTNSTSMGMGFDNSASQPLAPCPSAMDGSSFKTAKQTVAKESFEDKKLAAAKAMLTSNCVSTDEVMQLCRLFGFEQSKLDFAKFAYAKTSDRKNYSKVASVLTFDASKKSLTDFIHNSDK